MVILGRGKCLRTGGDRFGEFISACIGIDRLFISLHCVFRGSRRKNLHLRDSTFCAVKQIGVQVSVPDVRLKKEE